MKGRTGSTLSRTKYVKCFRVETSCYRVVLQKSIVTVELLYDQAESDFVQCFMESGLPYNPTMKQQPGMMTGRRSKTFEDLLYLFSSEDKYEGFSLY